MNTKEKLKPQPSKSLPNCDFYYSLINYVESSISQILDYSFSRFLFTNSLKSLPFSKFFESNARS